MTSPDQSGTPLIMKFTHYGGRGRNLKHSELADAWEIPKGSG